MNDLYSFFYWGDYNAQMAELAKRAQSEPWSFGNINDYSILKNYMKHTFQKLQSEGKIVTAKYYCIFNTGHMIIITNQFMYMQNLIID